MKNKFIITGLILLFCFLEIPAQTIYSNGTGGGLWSSPSTWLSGTVPDINSDVVIASGDSVYTTAGAVCRNLTVFSDGKFSTTIDTVHIGQTLTLESHAWFYNNTDRPKLPGNDFILDPQSYVVHAGSGTVGGTGNLEFGNLVIRRSAGTVPGGNLVVLGDLIVENTAYNVVFRGVRPASGSLTHTVEGNLYIYKGTFACIDVGDNSLTGIWNIAGNAYVIDNDGGDYQESRIGLFSSANAAGYAEINIGGDLIIQGGRLQGGTSSSAGPGNGVFKIGGNMIVDINSNFATNTLGSVGIIFNGTSPQHVYMDVRFNMGTVVNTTVSAGSEVIFDLDTNRWGATGGGDFVVNGSLELVDNSYLDGAGNFTLNPGAVLKIGSPLGLVSEAGNIQVMGARTYSPGAIYEYKSTSPQQLGDQLPNPLYGFAVSNPNNITLDRDLNVNGTLNIKNGDLILNGHTVSLTAGAVLTEIPGNTVAGETGKLMTAIDLNAPSGINPGGLGAVITSAANLGNTIVERYHYTSAGGGNEGISRVYKIAPSNNSDLNATLRLHYDESELNNIQEEYLRMFLSMDGSNNPWIKLWGAINITDNFVEAAGINEFHYFTLADYNSPLPVEEEESTMPAVFAVHQNYPNPFNPSTVIKYQVPQNSYISIKVYDVLGKEVASLVNETKTPGHYSVSFNAAGLSSGIYFYSLETGSIRILNKMMVLK
jgi:hypothetical protein